MKTISITELRANLMRTIEEIKKGKTIIVTSHGKPVAQINPLPDRRKDAIAKLNTLRKTWRCHFTHRRNLGSKPMNSPVILDTHVIIWDRLAPERVSPKARKAISQADREHGIVISEISLWEIAMLIRKGRIVTDVSYIELMTDILDSRNYVLQGITPEIAFLATEMSIDTKDPADKLIAATSIALGLPLISADRFMHKATEVRTIW
jgi:prevent-host-death family protein